VSPAAAALVALAATAILLVSPGPAAPIAAPSAPVPDQTAPVAFKSLGATYLSAPADPTLHLAFADVQNAGDHPITVTSVLFRADHDVPRNSTWPTAPGAMSTAAMPISPTSVSIVGA